MSRSKEQNELDDELEEILDEVQNMNSALVKLKGMFIKQNKSGMSNNNNKQ